MKKHVRPFEVFLFLFAVIIVLVIISFFIPSRGLHLGKYFHLHFPDPEEMLMPSKPDYADISHLFDDSGEVNDSLLPDYYGNGLTDDPDSVRLESDSLPDAVLNNLTDEITPVDDYFTPTVDEGTLRKLLSRLEFPPGNDTVIDVFYRELHSLKNSNLLLRIMHYGDSQIENDRISSVLRNRFQTRFGGSGIGMFPVVASVPHSASVRIIHEGNWIRKSPLSHTMRSTNHNRYGLLMSYSELASDPGREIEGVFSVSSTGIGYRLSRQMNELSIYFGYNKKPFVMELLSSGEIIDAELYFPSDSLILSRWTLPDNKKEFSVSVQGDAGPEIYSVSLDSSYGVAVNNVPLRGSSGLEFSATNSSVLRQMIEELNVKLVLLQFGVNVVPHIVDDYTYYENALRRQLEFLKSVAPETGGIVVGVSDMSRKIPGGYYVSYPNIELIRDAQRNAAFDAGFAFWDTYKAMGGKNSMPAWVNADPQLAQIDHIHFTLRGSAIVGDLLFTAIMDGYENYFKRLP